MLDIKKDRIYKHTLLDQRVADRYKPLIESAFANELAAYNNRPELKAEKVRFMAEQYANRVRVANIMGQSPLFEDAKIFSVFGDGVKNLFESVSEPGNIIGMGNVRNPMNQTDIAGGMSNPGYKPGTGDIPTYVFGLQNQIALHCIGFDLIPTIAVDTPKAVINYVDTVYGGGTLASTDNLPSFIELTNDVFTRSWIKASKLKRGVTELVITADTAGTKKALKVRFFLGSTVSSAISVEVISTGVMTTLPVDGTSAGVYTLDNSVTVADVIKASETAGAVNIIEVIAAVATDTIVDTLATGLYAGYASATRNNIAEATSNNNSLGGMQREQQEKGPKHKLNVIAIDKQVEMVGLEIEADTTNIQIKDMAAMGVNVISYLYSGVQNAIVQSLDEVILNHLYKLGVTHAANSIKSQNLNYSLYIGSATSFDANTLPENYLKDELDRDVRSTFGNISNAIIPGATLENLSTHVDRLYSRILVVGQYIKQQTRIAGADYLVASGEICSALKKHSTYIITPNQNTLTQEAGSVSYHGTVFGNIQVYQNVKVDFDDPRILMGRRGNDSDNGPKLLAYDLAASRQILAERTMAEKIRTWSRFQIANVGFYPYLNTYLFLAINDSKWV